MATSYNPNDLQNKPEVLQEYVTETQFAIEQASLTGQGGDTNNINVDTDTGEVTDVATGTILQYLYRYIHVALSDSEDGSNFGTDPDDFTDTSIYVGIANSTSVVAPTQAASYNFREFVWSSTHNLVYRVTGGNSITFRTTTDTNVSPELIYDSDTMAIDLFNVSAAGEEGPQGANGASSRVSRI